MKLTAALGMRGTFDVKLPFKIPYDETYEIISIRTVNSMLSQGIDVYQQVYLPVDIMRSEYEIDLRQDPKIVEIVSEGGAVYMIPDIYITSLPETNVPPYHRVVISVDMGVLPESLDLSILRSEMGQVASGLLGVAADARIHQMPHRGVITKEDHRTMEEMRSSNITERRTSYTRNIDLMRKVRLMSDHIQQLETLLRDNNLI